MDFVLLVRHDLHCGLRHEHAALIDMPQPDELTIFIDGPNSIEKCHLAETLQDILLSLGYLVHPDPNHGFYTPASLRTAAKNMPPIYLVEHDEAVEQSIEAEEKATRNAVQ